MARFQQRPRVENTQIFGLGAELGMRRTKHPPARPPPYPGVAPEIYLVGPAQDGEGEEARGEPGIQYILI